MTERDTSLRALEASESKLRRFVADASHELRTPLAAVRAYAELFTRGASSRPDDLERSMKGISRESERMSVLVEDLLLLAHLDEGRPLDARAGRARGRRRRVPRDGADARARPPDRGLARRRASSPATATASARSSTTCSRTSARTRRADAPRSASTLDTRRRERGADGRRLGPRHGRRDPARARLRALLPRRPVARPLERRRRPRARDRLGGRRGPRRPGRGRVAGRRRHDLQGDAAARRAR